MVREDNKYSSLTQVIPRQGQSLITGHRGGLNLKAVANNQLVNYAMLREQRANRIFRLISKEKEEAGLDHNLTTNQWNSSRHSEVQLNAMVINVRIIQRWGSKTTMNLKQIKNSTGN